jgi:hypothetical protein
MCGEAAEVVEAVEAAFDTVAQFVDLRVVRDDDLARSVGRDHRYGADAGNDRAQGVAVIGFVGEHIEARAKEIIALNFIEGFETAGLKALANLMSTLL